MRLFFDVNIQKRFDFVCWNETEEQRTEGMSDLPDKSTHTNAQSRTLPCWTGQPPHRAAHNRTPIH